ncbi:MAG TPA: leucyl/phenylalanyl-tRNA--protein transferase [Phycisphaerales bacterium]|nr:leucyl/phenylalanyl-tRNA--protein transferase [Phycisphaerales bacterium]
MHARRPNEVDPVPLLLEAWSRGVFPMADGRHGRVSFYEADPRSVLPLTDGGLRVSRSLRSLVRSGRFEVRSDTAFGAVVRACADQEREGSWINGWIIDAYDRLHAAGHAHSVEAYLGGELAGGLYGVHIGGVFFGESMFTRRERGASGASKVCLVHLWDHLRRRGFSMLDTQFANDHMRRFGIVEVPLPEFRVALAAALRRPACWGPFEAAPPR